MRIAFLTDLHLDHISDAAVHRFADKVAGLEPDMVLLGGDTSSAAHLGGHVAVLQRAVQVPVYGVLGNHDIWGSSFDDMHRSMDASDWWLQSREPIPLGHNTWLTGVDGWYDGAAGNYAASRVELNDVRMIREIRLRATRIDRRRIYRHLAEVSVDFVREKVNVAIARGARRILLGTHVPPFHSCALFAGKPSDADHAPFFVNVRLGQELLALAAECPAVEFTVLCGHTHHTADVQVVRNLRVFVGTAIYGAPDVAAVIHVRAEGVEIIAARPH